MILFGTKYRGFKLPDDLDLNENSVVYSVGVGEDVSFDVSLSYETDASIHIFDPTRRSIEHVNMVKTFFEDTEENRPADNVRYGGGDKNYLNYLEKHRVEPIKLICHDESVLYTEDKKTKSYISNKTDEYMGCNMKNISTIMKELKHEHIDLLKLEDATCDILRQLFDNEIFPTFICVHLDNVEISEQYGYKIIDSNNERCSLKMGKHVK
jgi:hypothetical protein